MFMNIIRSFVATFVMLGTILITIFGMEAVRLDDVLLGIASGATLMLLAGCMVLVVWEPEEIEEE